MNNGALKYCMSLKEENDDMIILGAFSMKNKYVYFDWVDKQIWVIKDSCYKA